MSAVAKEDEARLKLENMKKKTRKIAHGNLAHEIIFDVENFARKVGV